MYCQPTTIVLYLVLKALDLHKKDIVKNEITLHSIIYLVQRYCFNLGYSFSYTSQGPVDLSEDSQRIGISEYSLHIQLGRVCANWTDLSDCGKTLQPNLNAKLKKFKKAFKQMFGSNLDQYNQVLRDLRGLSLLHYLLFSTDIPYFEAALHLTSTPPFHQGINVRKLYKMINELENNPSLCQIDFY